MNLRTIVVAAQAIVYLGIGVYLLRQGYAYRRHAWSRGSWVRFTAAVVVSSLMMKFPMLYDLPHVAPRRSNSGGLLLVLDVAMLIGGAGLLTLLVWWFANGNPERQFLGASSEKSATLETPD